MIKKTVTEEGAGQRLDIFVAQILPSLSRAFSQKLIEDNKVVVNKQPEKASYHLRAGDKIAIDYDLKRQTQIPKIELPILYEDDDCVVIDKPAGVLSHSKGAFNPEATVATWLAGRWQGPSDSRAGIVHRLDRTTSGLIICAKHPAAQNWLQKQFSERKVQKTYIAIVPGHLEPAEAIIDMPIERHPRHPHLFRVGSNGKSAVTHYKVVESLGDYDVVELRPETGRTHQLRVHLKQLGHPIVGDVLYGGEEADRVYLHAASLELVLPSRSKLRIVSPKPKAFDNFREQNHG